MILLDVLRRWRAPALRVRLDRVTLASPWRVSVLVGGHWLRTGQTFAHDHDAERLQQWANGVGYYLRLKWSRSRRARVLNQIRSETGGACWRDPEYPYVRDADSTATFAEDVAL